MATGLPLCSTTIVFGTVPRGDALDEFVLLMRQVDLGTVHPFAVPFASEPDE